MTLAAIISKLLRGSFTNRSASIPEAYWILRKWNVLGNMDLAQLLKSRQIDTYRALYEAIKARSVTQVVDLGCNIAALGQLLYHYGWSGIYVGVDYNPFALAAASKALTIAKSTHILVQANIRALPFRCDCFECIVIKDVLEHMEDFLF
ncbi:MAG: class I SAM-dependent methyltransferase [Chloroflexi bacterium]|nr:class I SAM-dependent methyltransferase [Chloroflexota bacterium]